jgi:hypothetical protein
MKTHEISASLLIEAPTSVVYSIIADYHHGHPEILPKPPFVSLKVEEGGIGSGTIIRVSMKVMGKLQEFRSVITEPEPGRKLVETNDNGYITTFTVEPQAGILQSFVTISTILPGRTGVTGYLEYWFMNRFLYPVFVRELELLKTASLK